MEQTTIDSVWPVTSGRFADHLLLKYDMLAILAKNG